MKISFDQAIHLLKDGKVLAIATETVFGLATCYLNETGIEKIYSLKKRNRKKPLTLLISQKSQVATLALLPFPEKSLELMDAFWPGPLTIAFPVNEQTVPPFVRSFLPSVGLRMPDSQELLDLIDVTGPLACPSANISEEKETTSLEEVEFIFGSDFPIFSSDKKLSGLPSTVIAFQEKRWMILRQGSIKQSDFFPILGYTPLVN